MVSVYSVSHNVRGPRLHVVPKAANQSVSHRGVAKLLRDKP